MGARASRVGHLCVDLGHIEMTGDEQQELLRTVQAAVIGHLAKVASHYKVITISLSPNNGQAPKREEDAPPSPNPPRPPHEPPPAPSPPPPPQPIPPPKP